MAHLPSRRAAEEAASQSGKVQERVEFCEDDAEYREESVEVISSSESSAYGTSALLGVWDRDEVFAIDLDMGIGLRSFVHSECIRGGYG
jgi:hypothetical protein